MLAHSDPHLPFKPPLQSSESSHTHTQLSASSSSSHLHPFLRKVTLSVQKRPAAETLKDPAITGLSSCCNPVLDEVTLQHRSQWFKLNGPFFLMSQTVHQLVLYTFGP